MTDTRDTTATTTERTVTTGLLRQVALGCHRMAAQATQYTFQNAVDVVALADLLVSKGLITARELGERRALAERQVVGAREKEYAGPTLYPTRAGPPGEAAKTELLLDCDVRYGECGGACCTIYNVYLTAEEVRGGKYRWDLQEPYRLERGPDGACTYRDPETFRCTIWSDRPTVCRGYSCKTEDRIWVDFEKRIGTGLFKVRSAPPREGPG